jgi:hypothetical protein
MPNLINISLYKVFSKYLHLEVSPREPSETLICSFLASHITWYDHCLYKYHFPLLVYKLLNRGT